MSGAPRRAGAVVTMTFLTTPRTGNSLATMNSLKRFADPVYCLMRLVVGLLFACHGGRKLLGFPPVAKAMQLDTLGTVGGYIELICGSLIALGLLTRYAAFIASGMMAVAY